MFTPHSNSTHWDHGNPESFHFCCESYLPLPAQHARLIWKLEPEQARRVIFKQRQMTQPKREQCLRIHDQWRSPEFVRQWLHDQAVPYKTPVYLFYEQTVIHTIWKLVVLYWDAWAWDIGPHMTVTDLSSNWECEFHHENVITFRSHSSS